MSSYVPVAIYDLQGQFRGYSILNHEANKLKTTNVWTEAEQQQLQTQLDRLNTDSTLKAHWPALNDPEVAALLNDRTWEPIETRIADVVDDEHSFYVFEQVPELDRFGNETGRMVNGDIDRDASVLAFKKAEIPVRPIDAQIRTKKAQELIARKRAGR